CRQRVLHVEVVGQLGEDLTERPTRRTAHDLHADDRVHAGGALMHEMQFHVGALAFKGVLTRSMEVELLQLLVDTAQGQLAVALGFDLNGVSVVEDLTRGALVINRDWSAMKLGQQGQLSEVNQRLLVPVAASRPGRIELTPKGRAVGSEILE